MPHRPTGPVFAKLLAKDESKSEAKTTETMTIAAGCFWGVELAFQRVPGVISTQVGYTGGEKENPTYRDVCKGSSGHAEAVEIVFNPEVVSYEDLLALFWERHDATTLNRQGNDVGTQYRSAIFYHSEEQKTAAELSKKNHNSVVLFGEVVTEVVKASKFWPAEGNHQQYLEKGGQSAKKGDTAVIRCYG